MKVQRHSNSVFSVNFSNDNYFIISAINVINGENYIKEMSFDVKNLEKKDECLNANNDYWFKSETWLLKYNIKH